MLTEGRGVGFDFLLFTKVNPSSSTSVRFLLPEGSSVMPEGPGAESECLSMSFFSPGRQLGLSRLVEPSPIHQLYGPAVHGVTPNTSGNSFSQSYQ